MDNLHKGRVRLLARTKQVLRDEFGITDAQFYVLGSVTPRVTTYVADPAEAEKIALRLLELDWKVTTEPFGSGVRKVIGYLYYG
jgi:hypothetical protein